MKRYTVLLMRPDYMTDDSGSDTYLGWVKASTINEAIQKARADAVAHDKAEPARAADYAVIVTLAGWHKDITPEEYQ